MTKEGKVKWDELRDLKGTMKSDIKDLRALRTSQPAEREQIEAEISCERALGMISAVISD